MFVYGTPLYELEVASGRSKTDSARFVVSNKINQQISEGSTTIWGATSSEGNSGSIAFLNSNTQLYLSSTSASDINKDVLLLCVDEDFNDVRMVVTMNGQTPVALPSQVQYVLFASVISGSVNQGDVYVSPSATATGGVPDSTALIQTKILAEDGVTHNGFTVVPKGKVGILLAIRGTTDAESKPAQIRFYTTRNGVRIRQATYSVSPGFGGVNLVVPIGVTRFGEVNTPVFSEGTVFEFESEASTNGTNVFFGADILLVDEETVSLGPVT